MKKRKAQMNQVFTYIIALFVFVLILLYGYKAIGSFLSKGEEVQLVQFKNTLVNEVKKKQSDYGSVTVFSEKRPLNLPPGYNQICFIDQSKQPDFNSEFCKIDTATCQLWSDNLQQGIRLNENTFLIKEDRSIEGNTLLQSIKLKDKNNNELSSLCIDPKGNRIDLRLEGKGSYVELRELP